MNSAVHCTGFSIDSSWGREKEIVGWDGRVNAPPGTNAKISC